MADNQARADLQWQAASVFRVDFDFVDGAQLSSYRLRHMTLQVLRKTWGDQVSDIHKAYLFSRVTQQVFAR
jgi:hypothetical protein